MSFSEFAGLRVPTSLLTEITLDLEEVRFETALEKIAAKGGVVLNFNHNRIPVDQVVTVQVEEVATFEVLRLVMEATGTELVVTEEGHLAVVTEQGSEDEGRGNRSTVSGFVRDRKDGETLPNATVVVERGVFRSGTLTNDAGYFAVPDLPSGRCEITVSYIGYAVYRDTLWLNPGRDVRQDLELETEVLQVGEVVVEAEAEPVESELSRQPSVVALQMKSLQQIPAMGESDLLRSLQLLPGVQTASDLSSGLYVRGGGPDQTSIMLDQMRLYNPSHAFGFFSTFNPDAIKDVTFFKGAYPARYGGSLGAVLDVQNRDGNRREFGSSGGVSLISGRLMVEGPLGNGSWMVAGRRTYIDPVLNAIRGASDNLTEFGYYFYDVNGKVNSQLSHSDNLMISVYGGNDDLGVTGGEEADTLSFGTRWGNSAVTARWTHLFSPELFGRAIAAYSEYHSDITLELADTPFALRNRVRDLSLKADIDYFASAEHTLRSGMELTFFRFDYGFRYDQWKENLAVRPYLLSFYVQDDWKATPLTEARIGLRTSYYEEGRVISLNPRVSISRVLQEGLRLKLGGGRYRQYLQLNASEGFSGGDVWVPLDETVDPGRSWQGVTGLEWEPSPTFKVSLESYYTDLANLVVLDEEREENAEQETSEDVFKTGGEGYATGMELFAERRRGRLTGWLGYTLGWTRRRFSEIDQGRTFPPKYDRRHDLSLTGTYRFAPVCTTCGRWSVNASFVYATGQAFTPASARYSLRDPALVQPVGRYLAARKNTARLLPYHRLDVGVRRTLKLFGEGVDAEVYLQIFNLYNRRNEWFIEYDTEDPNKKPTIVSMMPILPTFGFDFRF